MGRALSRRTKLTAQPLKPRAQRVCTFRTTALLVAGPLLLLSACTDGGQTAELEDYLQRLSRPLGIEVIQAEVPTTPMPPRAESLRISLKGSKLDGLDFLRLRGCSLQQTVAKRNSSLGRVAPPSQRLLMELAFLREAPACIDTLLTDGREELASVIKESAVLKRSQLPALIFNATLGNREYRDFWRTVQAQEDYPAQTSSLVITALEQITADATRWLAGDYQVDETRFELALADIAQGDGGELLDALSRQRAYLDAANALIDRRIAKGPLCTDNTRGKAAPILRTVIGKFFVERIQVRAAELNKRYYQLSEPVTQLESLLSAVLTRDYQSWQENRKTKLSRDIAAPRHHVNQLQQLLGTCYAEFAPEVTKDIDL
ncbi:DUF3080 family protein [Congregibacter variabilis]|uniref:DUF3080 family protein n=1 Tax=Congregibacter variabilis TaxID=3081200 RepID=A0ABZ0HXV8_9GAMM|nr:DUF3080 family protein [Congregibacter sp. IMCC43200]